MQPEIRFLNLTDNSTGNYAILNGKKHLLPKKAMFSEYFFVLPQNEIMISFSENKRTSTLKLKFSASGGRQTLIIEGKKQEIRAYVIPEPVSLSRLDRVYIRFINLTREDALVTRQNGEEFVNTIPQGRSTLFMSALPGRYFFSVKGHSLKIQETLSEPRLFSFIIYNDTQMRYFLVSERNSFFDI